VIFVTGGAGFIGSNFVRQHIGTTGESVVNVDLLTYAGNASNVASLNDDPRHVFVKADIGDAEVIGTLLAHHRPRAIINFAAESHVDRSTAQPNLFKPTL
jgi:dTDP-glucose 4,6-dehydratase